MAVTLQALRRNASKALDTLNRRYIYGKVPLLHTIVFLVEIAIMSRIAAKFNSSYADRPVLTMMVTNAILGAVADTVAQSITAIRQRAVRSGKDDFMSIEIHELDTKNPLSERELIPASKDLPPPFDFERMTRFMAYGFLMAPLNFKWFQFLARAFPITKQSGTIPALKRVACDQLMFAPCGIAAFFSFMTIAEGGGRRAIFKKLEDVYVPTLKVNYMIWPAVQVLNFRIIPVKLQLPFVSTVGIAWTAYMSLTNQVENL